MTDELVSGFGLLLVAFGVGLVVGAVVSPIAGAGVVAAVIGAGLLVYALFLTPSPEVPPEA